MIKNILFHHQSVLFAETDTVNKQINHVNTTHSGSNSYPALEFNLMLQFLGVTLIYLAILWIFMSKLLPRIKRGFRAVALAIEFQNTWFITSGLAKQALIDPDLSVTEFEYQLKCKGVRMLNKTLQHPHSYTRVYREAEERYILAIKNKFLENSFRESFSLPLNYRLRRKVDKKRESLLRDEIRIDSIKVDRFAWLKKNSIIIAQVDVTGREYEYEKESKQHLQDFTQWRDYIVLAKDVKNEQWKIINLIQEGKILSD